MIRKIQRGFAVLEVGCCDAARRAAGRQNGVFSEVERRSAVHRAASQRIVVLTCEEK